MNEWHVRLAAEAVLSGGVIACPTEAVFGLSCLPSDKDAVEELLALKQRPASKGLIVVASSVAQLAGLVDVHDSPMIGEISSSWPGPMSWILPGQHSTPAWLCGKQGDLAVRVTSHSVLLLLCEICGPLVSTSANLAGVVPARSAHRVRSYFGDKLAYILPGKLGDSMQPSEIRHGQSGQVLRSGG